MAYKAIRKQGVQKKLDERALKNEGLFKQSNEALKKLKQNFNKEKIKANYEEIIHDMGICPLSQCDLLDLME